MGEEITKDDILGVSSRTVTPRKAPHGYQVEQWERHTEAFKTAQFENPLLDEDSFLAGWNAAFTAIYG